MPKQFWVIGGHYRDTEFHELEEGATPETFGPFRSYEEANVVWRARSTETRPQCCVRYAIVASAGAEMRAG